jgi:hypothetical protein
MRHPRKRPPQIENHLMDGKRTQVKHKNHFDSLINEPECYIYHNYGHKVVDCCLKNYKSDLNFSAENVKVWKKKESDKYGLVLLAQRQKNPWNIDSRCSKHMTGEKDRLFLIRKIKTENVILENDELGKNKDKGMVSLCNGKGDSQDDLPINGMKHNFLNVSQMCDRGCKEVVLSKHSKIKSLNSGQVVAKHIRTNNNVDIESSAVSKEEDTDTIKECPVSIYPMEEAEEESCHNMEAKVLKVENSNTQSKFLNSSMTLDKLLDSHRSPNDKSGIGYNKEEINTPKKPDTGPSYVKKKSKYESGSNGFLL